MLGLLRRRALTPVVESKFTSRDESVMKNILASIADGLNIRDSYDDWLVFVARLHELVASGRIRRISSLPNRYFEKNDEWYLDPETGEIYVHGLPNAPVLPVWERFDIIEHTRAPKPLPDDLSVIPIGKISRAEAKNLKGLLAFLARQGLVEILDPLNVKSQACPGWRIKDLKTEAIYRLVEKNGGEDN
jgi:hypothetical protein